MKSPSQRDICTPMFIAALFPISKTWKRTKYLQRNEWPSSVSLQTTVGEGVEKKELSYTVGGNVNWYSHYGEQYGDSFKKLKIELPYDPAILLLGIHPEKTILQRHRMHPSVHCCTIYNNQDMETT